MNWLAETKPYPHLLFFQLRLYCKYCSAARNIHDNEARSNLAEISYTRAKASLQYNFLILNMIYNHCLIIHKASITAILMLITTVTSAELFCLKLIGKIIFDSLRLPIGLSTIMLTTASTKTAH